MRSVTILGSSGSVGSNTVDLLQNNRDDFFVEALVAHKNVHKLIEQSLLLNPKFAVIADPSLYDVLKVGLSGTTIEIAAGEEAVLEAAQRPSDWVMSAIVGAAGLKPTLEAIKRGCVIGLANKETLVSAGLFVMAEVKKHKATLIPVDSEHSAIYQIFDFEQKNTIEKIILTASGGPFRKASYEEMKSATPEQAVAHPNWSMGAKISVDSASMMNKGLELIEAYHLFDLPEDQIDILVHPQSVIHSMVTYIDGSVLAQLGTPDMRTPIAYALGWPKRMSAPCKKLNFTETKTLTFEAPDPLRFPALRLAREALREGGGVPTIFNAANEVAVELFLNRKIGFLQIPVLVEKTIEKMHHGEILTLEAILTLDQEARKLARNIGSKL
jgi:1-deoxy-D-xylulose-5-phosphate reductoisomerase